MTCPSYVDFLLSHHLTGTAHDYFQIKQGIRAPGLSEIRKNAQVLIKAGEDGEEAENLQNA